MAYTTGNWTVEPLFEDSISTPKTLSIPDLSYDTDYSVSQRRATEVRVANTTGNELFTSEQLRYGRLSVDDIYRTNAMDIPQHQRAKNPSGIQTVMETRYLLKATNSVSGEEIFLPVRAWSGLAIPTTSILTSQALLDLYLRHVAVAFATGQTDGALITSVARGDLDPTA